MKGLPRCCQTCLLLERKNHKHNASADGHRDQALALAHRLLHYYPVQRWNRT